MSIRGQHRSFLSRRVFDSTLRMNTRYSRYSDAELSALLSSPEEKDAAFTELYARYSQKIYVFALRMTGDADDANDVFQETFVRFYNRDSGKAPIANIPAFLFTAARHIFLNRRRDGSRWKAFDGDSLLTYSKPYEREELFNMVSSALGLLDDTYREAFVLRFYEGLSYREMSDITGDSISALKVRVMRAKDQIRSILSPYIADHSRFPDH